VKQIEKKQATNTAVIYKSVIMASYQDVVTKMELTAVASNPVPFRWKVQNLKELLDNTIDKGEEVIASLGPFNLVRTVK